MHQKLKTTFIVISGLQTAGQQLSYNDKILIILDEIVVKHPSVTIENHDAISNEIIEKKNV